ncbi:MAG: class I SAM-dependent methyltransferase [Candidatus Paceibacteria bacterium]
MEFKPQKEESKLFLAEEINKPRSQWSANFKKFIKESKEDSLHRKASILNKEAGEIDKISEVEQKQVFSRYLAELGLSERDIKDKRIMDLGFGNGEFIKYLLSQGITSSAYGIDSHPGVEVIEDRFKENLFEQSSEVDLPVKDLDYVLAIRFVWPNWEWADLPPMDIKKVLENSLKSLKVGGEIRIYPIEESAEGNNDKNFTEEQWRVWASVLEELSKKYSFEQRIEPRNIFVNTENDDVTLQSVLVLLKR